VARACSRKFVARGFVNGDQTHAQRFARRVRKPLERSFLQSRKALFFILPPQRRSFDSSVSCACKIRWSKVYTEDMKHMWQLHKQSFDLGCQVLTEGRTPLLAVASSAFRSLGLLWVTYDVCTYIRYVQEQKEKARRDSHRPQNVEPGIDCMQLMSCMGTLHFGPPIASLVRNLSEACLIASDFLQLLAWARHRNGRNLEIGRQYPNILAQALLCKDPIFSTWTC